MTMNQLGRGLLEDLPHRQLMGGGAADGGVAPPTPTHGHMNRAKTIVSKKLSVPFVLVHKIVCLFYNVFLFFYFIVISIALLCNQHLPTFP